jgi:hypothetical protein
VRTTCMSVHFGRGVEAQKVRSGRASAEVVCGERSAIEGRVGNFAGSWNRRSVEGRMRRRMVWSGMVGLVSLM